jgi:hypothetical protein
MWHKVKIHFNSSILTTFFLLTAIGFTVLLITIWSISVESEKKAHLQRYERFIISGIRASIFGSAELGTRGLEQQSQTLIQDYLKLTFEDETNTNPQSKHMAKLFIYLLNPSNHTQTKELIGEWHPKNEIDSKCIEKRIEYIQPTRSLLTYEVDLELNTCSSSSLSILEYHNLTAIIAFAVILVWGIFIYAMIRSVSYAINLLGCSENTSYLLEKTEQIRWTNVGALAQRALQVRGKNLQYYQTLVLDAQHDIAKVLDLINRKYDYKELNQSISIVRGIMQTLATEVRSGNSANDVTGHRELSTEELIKLLKIYFSGVIIKNELPKNFSLHVSDIAIFERILVNLAANFVKHSTADNSWLELTFKDNFFMLKLFNLISDYNAFKLNLAKLTGRIDLQNSETPVYVKLFGRTGRGLSIVKRGTIKLGGKLIFNINKKLVETGICLPAQAPLSIYTKSGLDPLKKRQRAIIFKNPEFTQHAIEKELTHFIIDEATLQKLIKENKNLEIVSDYEIAVPTNSTLRILSKKERIDGIALNWLGKKQETT